MRGGTGSFRSDSFGLLETETLGEPRLLLLLFLLFLLLPALNSSGEEWSFSLIAVVFWSYEKKTVYYSHAAQ